MRESHFISVILPLKFRCIGNLFTIFNRPFTISFPKLTFFFPPHCTNFVNFGILSPKSNIIRILTSNKFFGNKFHFLAIHFIECVEIE